MSAAPLPIEGVREDVLAALEAGPVVLSAPTGSGKSTQVPRWLGGRVVVVEPRRVACRSLASRVAELGGAELGEEVGYAVRDERRRGADTRVLFVTPGIALRDLALLEAADHVVLDEFHERRLDVDLLLGLLARRPSGLTVMSATLDGDRVAAHLRGRHVAGQGRVHPVEVRYRDRGVDQPRPKGLEDRVVAALDEALQAPGDVLVFLPGRGEIAACAERLRSRRDLAVLELHGGLSLADQSRVFRPQERRKVVLATNVAETSVTIPGVGVVIDSGLVRRTRYHKGRGFLTLSSIALDSAEQRAGRAGRTGPGLCLRLWSEAAILEARTPPEVHRESLVPMVLGAAAAGHRLEDLPLLDPPKPYAIEAARGELEALGAFDDAGRLTPVGVELHAQPLDAPHARLVVEARRRSPELVGDAIDLVAALAVGRPLFSGPPDPDAEEDELRLPGCDAVATIRAVRGGDVRADRLSPFALREARSTAARLRSAHGLPARGEDRPIDRKALAEVVLAADPRAAYVARRRRREVAFGNGGTEVQLARESAAQLRLADVEAILVLDTRALGLGTRDTLILATAAMPVPLTWLRDAGLGRDRVVGAHVVDGRARARVERVYARRVLDVREEVPRGAAAIEAIARLVLDGRALPGAGAAVEERLSAHRLAARLSLGPGGERAASAWPAGGQVPGLEAFLRDRLAEVGVETGADLALLSAEDLLPPELEPAVREVLDRDFPRRFELGDAAYEVDYDLGRRQVLCRMVRGSRTGPPPLGYLPRFPGFRICIESKRAMHVVRER